MFLKHHPNILTFSCRLKLKRFLLPTTNSWCRLSGKPGDSTAEILHVTSAPLFSATPFWLWHSMCQTQGVQLENCASSLLREFTQNTVWQPNTKCRKCDVTKPNHSLPSQHLVGQVCSYIFFKKVKFDHEEYGPELRIWEFDRTYVAIKMIGDVTTMSAVLIFDVLLLEFRHDAFGLIFQTQMALQFTKTISKSAMVEQFNFFLFFPFAVVKKQNSHPGQKCLLRIWLRDPKPKLTRVIYNRFRWKRETVAGAFASR